jgi:lactoylglutathione lyase
MRFWFTYTGIRVRDLDRSERFYVDILGMKKISRGNMPHGGRFVHLKSPGSPQRLELNWYPKGSRFYKKYARGEELDHLAFYVKNVRDAYEELTKKGADAAVKPSEAKGTEVYIKDPDGIWIELLD